MDNHFEHVWEKCENFHQANSEIENSDEVISELEMKIQIFKTLLKKPEIPSADLIELKKRTFGEILMTLANLSLKENINVFEAMVRSLQFHNIDLLNKKYPE